MGQYVVLALSEIQIPKEFEEHPPDPNKVEARRKEWMRRHKFNKDMKITSGQLLVDGYASFVALAQLGVTSARFKIRDNAYVVKAWHPQYPGKLYLWRTNSGGMRNFTKGDHIAVNTRDGVREAIVDSVCEMPAGECFGLRAAIGKWNPDKIKNKNN